mmetsp:Transcript_19051/g.59951  ORF Transcript_19051/g.59951 Transcript_19051/m.59951 type:complete len:245 (-) Transcript_19051:275-1009(-)
MGGRYTHLHLHLQPVEDAILRIAVLVALDNLNHLVARLAVKERGDAHVGDEIARDLARVERVLAADEERARRRVRLEPARAHNRPVHTRLAQVLLRHQLLLEHVAKGVRDLVAGRVELPPRAGVGEDRRDEHHLLHARHLGRIDQLHRPDVVHSVRRVVHLEGVAGDESNGDYQAVCALQRARHVVDTRLLHVERREAHRARVDRGALLDHGAAHLNLGLRQLLRRLCRVTHSSHRCHAASLGE